MEVIKVKLTYILGVEGSFGNAYIVY